MFGEPAYLVGNAPHRGHPSVVIDIQKLGNGFVVTLQTNPKPPVVQQGPPVEEVDPDEQLDRLIDGIGAFLREINDKGAGEGWKDGEDRQKVRAAARLMFPSVLGSGRVAHYTTQEKPRYEQLVFESKDMLLEYLTKNL
jgi:hypothetical protein